MLEEELFATHTTSDIRYSSTYGNIVGTGSFVGSYVVGSLVGSYVVGCILYTYKSNI